MPIYTVSQISDAIKKTLEGSFSALQIRGEISNLRAQSSGHIYFTLKDESAQLSCALFRLDAARLKKPLKDGDQIVALGNLSLFAPKGTYQLIVKQVQHQGLGELLIKFEALKNSYKAKGYFELSRKKPLPRFANTIGVITSPTGAVIQDIIQTLSHRHRGFKLLLIPTKVQGEGAATEIANALDAMNHYNLCDLIICGRGGGSLEDLWCFNEEIVVEAIYRSRLPVISAVGHETDFTLADFVADARAPTPTAAAVMALFDLGEFMKQINQLFEAISKLFSKKIDHDKKVLLQLKKRPELSSPATTFQGFYFSLDKIRARLESLSKLNLHKKQQLLNEKKALLIRLKPDNQLKNKTAQLASLKQKLSYLGQKLVTAKRYHLQTLSGLITTRLPLVLKDKKSALLQTRQLLQSIHPDHVLDIGYVIMESVDGQTVYTSLHQIGQELRLKAKDGSCIVSVNTKALL